MGCRQSAEQQVSADIEHESKPLHRMSTMSKTTDFATDSSSEYHACFHPLPFWMNLEVTPERNEGQRRHDQALRVQMTRNSKSWMKPEVTQLQTEEVQGRNNITQIQRNSQSLPIALLANRNSDGDLRVNPEDEIILSRLTSLIKTQRRELSSTFWREKPKNEVTPFSEETCRRGLTGNSTDHVQINPEDTILSITRYSSNPPNLELSSNFWREKPKNEMTPFLERIYQQRQQLNQNNGSARA